MKYEWRKKEKDLYLPKDEPVELMVPKLQYLTIEGRGNPNDQDFSKRVEALYSLSYGLKMLPKKGVIPEGHFDYTVFPLEGIWDLSPRGKEMQKEGEAVVLLKDELVYKLMIRQPDFITEELFEEVKEEVFSKKKNQEILKVTFETIEEGKSLQMLHMGSYDEEPATFKIMEDYCKEHGLIRKDKRHKEIYLTDPKKVADDKLKTVLRIWLA